MKAVSAQVISCCVYDKPPKIMQYILENILYLFDLRAGLLVHLLLLKTSMVVRLPVGFLLRHYDPDVISAKNTSASDIKCNFFTFVCCKIA